MNTQWIGAANPRELSDVDFAAAASRLGCDPAAIRAVWGVEAAGRHFLADGSVVRRFEPHHFPREHWERIGFFPRAGEAAWRASVRLSTETMFQSAAAIDQTAAMAASSWGAPQIMGFNCRSAGFDTAEAMVSHMAVSAAHQLGAFVQLVEGWGLDSALRAQDWTTFAARYNGSGQVPVYAARIEAAYRQHSGVPSPVVLRIGDRGAAVTALQRALGTQDDGVFGPGTDQAVRAFQATAGLPVDGVVGRRTWDALGVAAPDAAEPPVQETPVDRRTDITATVTGAGAAMTAIGAGAAQLRTALPESAFSVLVWGAVGLAAIWLLARALRRWRGAVR
ncbi:N-acetylmuramidase domain-containing protein [Pararhodobacter zhoushanensis]|uniref:N-acetylmuramidase domain-containing protein n=1 Tax=Pararhodobacter zhoushanensis TaxID=2479545 RepID=UPI0013DEF516|nr:N-acetylmuramidase domain-containing protein [Pararhodobacter zhoushanensis]